MTMLAIASMPAIKLVCTEGVAEETFPAALASYVPDSDDKVGANVPGL